MTILTKFEDIDRMMWSDFVASNIKGNVFQTPEYYDALSITDHNSPIIVCAIDKNKILGLVLGNVITNGNIIAKIITARSIIIGGPIIGENSAEIIKLLLNEYNKQLPSYVIYTEIRPVYSMDDFSQSICACGFYRVGHYNLFMDITRDEDVLYAAMHRERRRNVAHAEKAGLVFKEIHDTEDIKHVVKLIKQTYERKHVPLSYLGVFDAAYDKMSLYTHFFGAWSAEGKMIAGQVRLCYGKLVYAWFAGSNDAYFKQRPNDYLMWNVIRWGHNNGYELFDFGGGGEPGVKYGVRDYKLKYGCECFDYGRYIIAYRPITYKLASFAYKTLQKIRNVLNV